MIFDLMIEMYEDPMDGVITVLQVILGAIGTALCVLVSVIL